MSVESAPTGVPAAVQPTHPHTNHSHSRSRSSRAGTQTGIRVRGTVRGDAQRAAVAPHALQTWLEGVAASQPGLAPFFNDQPLHAADAAPSGAPPS